MLGSRSQHWDYFLTVHRSMKLKQWMLEVFSLKFWLWLELIQVNSLGYHKEQRKRGVHIFHEISPIILFTLILFQMYLLHYRFYYWNQASSFFRYVGQGYWSARELHGPNLWCTDSGNRHCFFYVKCCDEGHKSSWLDWRVIVLFSCLWENQLSIFVTVAL